ncbi:signal recognition particle receptor subunit beta-like [Ornithodoros turicata]|uniref:signal recognition particle receptor subunit beta-like n=1 Tax=Ornithodoros turicata TaxID=34597 RepID=UPI003139B69F
MAVNDVLSLLNIVKHKVIALDPLTIAVLSAVIVILLTTILLLRKTATVRRAVLIVGLSDSGKTLLYSQLVAQKKVETYTSMKENKSSVDIPKKAPLNLVDLPGNNRIRAKFFDNFKSLARAVIFVVDSSSFSRDVRDVAELLYSLLCDGAISQHCPPFLIVCNKQDEAMAKSSKVVQSQLEKEMNVLRSTQVSALESTEGQSNNNTFLGKRGKDFQFMDLKPIAVDFVEFSAAAPEESQLSCLRSWLAKVA